MRTKLLLALPLLASIVSSARTARADGGSPAPVSILAMHDEAPPDSTRDSPARAPSSDHLFPGAGHATVGASTGVPFLAIGEAGYAFGDGFTLGAIAGVTPEVVGFGLRPRVILYGGARARVFVVAPILYYPATHMSGGEPWFLTNPVLNVEVPLSSSWRARGGAGFVFAACQDSLIGVEHEERFMGDLWPTLSAGVSHPIGASSEIFADLQAVLPKGVAFDDDWIGGPPVVLSLGVAASL